jgi:hypothetical protein
MRTFDNEQIHVLFPQTSLNLHLSRLHIRHDDVAFYWAPLSAIDTPNITDPSNIPVSSASTDDEASHSDPATDVHETGSLLETSDTRPAEILTPSNQKSIDTEDTKQKLQGTAKPLTTDGVDRREESTTDDLLAVPSLLDYGPTR